MKKMLGLFILASVLSACSDPALKWIDTISIQTYSHDGFAGSKEIISFSFGIEGEIDLPIGGEHDISGKIPIAIILPEGTDVRALAPAIQFIGKSLSPSSGVLQDFSSPVNYKVTADDGSTADYLVTVYVKGPSSNEIVYFVLDVSRSNPSGKGTVVGIIDQEKGTITVTVPAGTALTSLTAQVTHIGHLTMDSLNRTHVEETFDFTGDFSKEITWTVIAQDNSTKVYTVTVVKEKSNDKEIRSFSFGIPGETEIIGQEPLPDGKYPIVVLIPSVEDVKDKVPHIIYTGAAISPDLGTKVDFSSPNIPKTYTVTAEDGSTREYTVNIVQKASVQDNEKLITGFYFKDPLVQGVIDQVNYTIALTVPGGTDLSALRPEIYYKGASVSPISGQPRDFTGADTTPVKYTVRNQSGESQAYEVYVFITPAPVVDVSGAGSGAKVGVGINTDSGTDTDSGNYPVIVEFPTHIEDNSTNINNPVINITYPAASTVDNETLNQILNQLILLENKDTVYNHITNETINNYITNSNTTNNTNYTEISTDVNVDVTVINPPPDNPQAPDPDPPPLSNAASIDGFYFTSPAAVGEIDQDKGTISVTVPYGTDLRNLTAGICYTGKEIAGIPGTNPLKHTASFTGPVTYQVNAADGTTKNYMVTVTAAKNSAKEITAVSLFSGDDRKDTSVIISAMPNAAGKYPIDITVSEIGSFTPQITFTGKTITGENFSSPSGSSPAKTDSAVDFSSKNPAEYTVTAEDGTTKTYILTVHAESNDSEPEITGFYFTNPLAAGMVNQNTNTISVTVPSGANLRVLAPTLYFNGISVNPASDVTNDFSAPVVYTVTGTTGKTRRYTVTVNSMASNVKDITSFTFPGVADSQTVIGAVPDSDGTYPIAVWVPAGMSLDSIAPTIGYTEGSAISPASGTPQNFNDPKTYTISAEDGTTKTYKVTVNPRSDEAIITSFIFNEVPLTGGAIRVVASIDQENRTITATVPAAADISSLVPTLTYIGKSIIEPSGSERTSNPFTGAAKDFSTTQTYTVKNQIGLPQSYTVQVTKQKLGAVTFTGEAEKTVIDTYTFDQQTGVVTVTVDDTVISAGWYLDGHKQALGDDTKSFTLNTGDGSLTPGRHEIMVSGKHSDGLYYTGKVYFEVAQ
ncbi:MAG: DUF5018 domain-containing protein [Treponema sp.]|jgi:hypothetical protein|nr:DUF5018 domain-containing protein [Treponema sp.]